MKITNYVLIEKGKQKGCNVIIPDYVHIVVGSKEIPIYKRYTDEIIGNATNFNWINDRKIVADLAVGISLEIEQPIFVARGRERSFWFGGMRYIPEMRIEGINCIEEKDALRFTIIKEEEEK